jgi:protein ImuB
MMRLACLYVPDFPLAALLRTEPDLRGEPVVVADGPGPRARLLAVSAAAARHGVTAPLTVAQAAAIDAGLVIRPVSPDTLRAAQAALCDAAESFSPRIEDGGDGVAYLDLDGLGTLFDSSDGELPHWEPRLANALAQRAAHLGLDAHVGVAGSKVAAHIAARNGGGVTVIPHGEEAGLLAPVPVTLLEPSPALAATLQRWGIRCIGDLAALPASAVGARLGAEGVQLVRQARGEDEYPLVPRPLPLYFEEGIDLDYGIDGIEPLLFVLRGLLDRLTARLAVRGFLCGDLRLSLRLATRGRDERTVTVAAPSNHVKALLTLVRLQLEAHPPVAAIEAFRIAIVPERLRAAQLDLFRPNGPAPGQLAVTLARLSAICGADHVGTPVVADSHRPDAYGLASFVGSVDKLQQTLRDGPEKMGPPQGERKYFFESHNRTVRPEEPPSPGGVSKPALSPVEGGMVARHSTGIGNGAGYIPLALRAIRPPRSVAVFCERDRPAFVRGESFAGRVVHAAGPWRVHSEWWSDGCYARDYYDMQLSDGCVYRLYCDLTTHSWLVDGVYD